MGLYNELVLKNQNQEVRIQFRYGFMRVLEYQLGDKVSWEGVERPTEADGQIVVSGIADDPSDKATDRYYAITVENDVIVYAQEISRKEFDALESR